MDNPLTARRVLNHLLKEGAFFLRNMRHHFPPAFRGVENFRSPPSK
jgi:hypothetical protein